jgi:hypothetical protein
MKNKTPFLILLAFFGLCSGLQAQPGVYLLTEDRYLDSAEYKDYLPEDFTFFNRSTPLKMELVSDFKKLVRRKFDEEYQEASLNVKISDEIEIRHNIRIKPRGNFRLKNCKNPPIMLNFKKGEFPVANLKNLDKIKLVNTCSDGNRYEEYLLKEYLAYRLYNMITENSFQVCFVKIDFVDTGRNEKVHTNYGFLIEEGDAMAERLGMQYLGGKGILPENTEPFHAAELAVFQYMIGNTDWSIKGKHNTKVLAEEFEDGRVELYAVPYDFDYCGLVDAPYAVPPEFLEIKTVTERVFRSYCSTDEEFDAAFKKFQELRPDFYQLIEEFDYLSENTRKRLTQYLDEFYDILDSPKKIKATIKSECRTRESSSKG